MLPLDPAQPVYGYRPADHDAPPAVSVITPYFNTGALFLETAQSLLRQSLQQWEWIIVNDGSTDAAALRVLLPFRSADGRIRVIDQPNRGLPAARNAGAAAARAPLLFFLDSDDLLAPTALEKLVWSLISRPESAFATSWTTTFGAEHFNWPRGFDTRYAFLYENMASSQAIVRRSVFERVGGFDASLRQGMEDYEFWLRCAAHGFWGHDLPEYLIAIRRKTPSEYAGYRWDARDDKQSIDAFRREMRRRYPELYRNGLPRIGAGGGLLDTYALVDPEPPFANLLAPAKAGRRILVLLPWIRTGGSDRFALDLIEGLIGRGDQVSVALLREAEHTWLAPLQRLTPDVFPLPGFLALADEPRFLRYLIASRRIDTVLISNSLLAYQLLPFLRAFCPAVRFVDYLHMEEEHWRHGGIPRAALDHDGLLDMHIVSSQHLRSWLLERGADAERTHVCTTNIDPSRWQPNPERRVQVRRERGIADGTTVILFAARLVAQKRPRLALEILRRLRAEGLDFACIIAGDGEDRGWVERFVRRHKLESQVRMIGAVPPERMPELLDTADVLLLPSEQEGIALAIYEAMAMEVVPVAADVGGQRELVTLECGVLISHDADEVEQYVRALRRLIEDSVVRREMAAAGRERIVAHFSHTAMLDCMQALFAQADGLARSHPRPRVSPGQAQAAAALAIDHQQLEERLRRLPPVKFALRLRQSPLATIAGPLASLRHQVERLDRAAYASRREVMKRVKRKT